ncbi:MAG: hypothetical protein HY262_05275 [Chloroflexi bacterium]|nr:hypothetical protein [Chloroflexota bacterium]
MDLGPLFVWLKLVHVLAALALVLAHGASAAVAFKLRGERDRLRIGALIDLSSAYLNAFYLALVVVLVAGILAGISAGYWTSGQLWIWASVIVFVAVIVGMYALAMPYFRDVRHALGMATFQDVQRRIGAPPPAGDDELAALLTSGRPMAIAAIGTGGIVLLVYLMVLKPF